MGVLMGYWAAVLSFQPFMITASLIPLLIMGRIAPGLFIQHKVIGKVIRGNYRVLKETSEYHLVFLISFIYTYYPSLIIYAHSIFFIDLIDIILILVCQTQVLFKFL